MNKVRLKSNVMTGSGATAVAASVGFCCQLLQLLILGNLLNPEDFGVIAVLMLVIGFGVSIADLGLANYLMYLDLLSIQNFRRYFLVSMGASTLISCGIYFSTTKIALFFKIPILVVYLPWMAPIVILATVGQMMGMLLQKNFLFFKMAQVDIISTIAGLVVAIVFALFGWGVWALVFGQIANTCLRAIMSFIFAEPCIHGLPQKSEKEMQYITATNFGFFQVCERSLNFFSANIDKIIIGKLLGEHALGIYSVAFQLVQRPTQAINPIFNRVVLPMFSQIKNDNRKLTYHYFKLLKYIALSTFPIYIILSVSAPLLIEILFHEQWSPVSQILPILCMLGIVFAICNPIGNLIIVKGRSDLALYLNLFSVFVSGLFVYVGAESSLGWAVTLLVVISWVLIFPVTISMHYYLIGSHFFYYLWKIKSYLLAGIIPLIFCSIIHYYGIISYNLVTLSIANTLSIAFFLAVIFFTDLRFLKKIMIKLF